jgi:hypothetical protein
MSKCDADLTSSTLLNRVSDRHVDECPSCQGKLDRLVKDEAVPERASSPRLPGLDDPPHIPGFMIEHERAEGPPAWSIRRDSRA